MKRKFLMSLGAFALCFSLTACSLGHDGTANVLGAPDFTTATSETSEKTSDGEVTAYLESEWTNLADNTMNGYLWHDSIYTDGVPGDFYIAKECTFDKMRLDLDKVTKAYDGTDTFNRVFSMFYGSEELWYTVPDETKIWTLARLAALSYSLDMVNIDHIDDWKVKFMTCKDGSEDELIFSFYENGELDESKWKMDVQYDYRTGKLYRQLAGEDSCKEFTVPLSNGLNSFDQTIIKSFADIINISLHGGELEYGDLGIKTSGESAFVDSLMPEDNWNKVDWLLFDKSTHTGSKDSSEFYKYTLHEWLFERGDGKEEDTSEEKPASEEKPSEVLSSGVSFKDFHYQYLAGYEEEVEKAITDFYGCPIAEINDKDYDESEGATITMTNGKKCSYYGTTDMITITDMESYEYIFKTACVPKN